MKRIWGMYEAKNLWRLENGDEFDAENLHPVVVNTPIREYTMGIKKHGDEDAVIVHSYDPRMQPGAARNFALMVWNEKKDWTKPDLDSKIISCLGAPACEACMGESLPAIDVASRWRVNPYVLDDKLTAGRWLDPSDPESDMTIDEHLFAEIRSETDMLRIQAELTRRCVALFGPPYDIHTGAIHPVYSRVYESKET